MMVRVALIRLIIFALTLALSCTAPKLGSLTVEPHPTVVLLSVHGSREHASGQLTARKESVFGEDSDCINEEDRD